MILDIERLQQEKVSHQDLDKAMNDYTLQFQRFLQNSLEAHKRETAQQISLLRGFLRNHDDRALQSYIGESSNMAVAKEMQTAKER